MMGASMRRLRSTSCARRGLPDMFKVRVIPCLDVKDGRVVKGVNFVESAGRGRPGRGRQGL